MKNIYIKTTWIDNKTPVNAANMNKIENAISDLYSNALSSSDFKEGDGVTITRTKNKELEFSLTNDVVRSSSCIGIETISEADYPSSPKQGTLYILLDNDTKRMKKMLINGVIIYEVVL